ncbi:RNA methyltransferase [Diplogelasinospora grovesii]|uniref:rRNA methyltransferase 1, mitochondrial n=1 Tax=Diplogelasinospora grovesii TaxID=303347 RepID=A0AAN6NLL1_9PEZI|nr:RNA methyltransferase [Diplogelasinospora grovesii]
MGSVTALRLLSQAVSARPALSARLAAPAAGLTLTSLQIRAASLSAIHQGIRRSEKASPRAESERRLTYAERRKVRAAIPKPTFKIRKGKKDITEYEGKAQPQSRRARFYDPENSFAKKSLVHKLKTGKLIDELKSLEGEEKKNYHSTESFFREFGSGDREGTRDRAPRRSEGFRGREPRDRGDFGDREPRERKPRDREVKGFRDREPRDREDFRNREPRDEGYLRREWKPRDREGFRDREPRERERITEEESWVRDPKEPARFKKGEAEVWARNVFKGALPWKERQGGREDRRPFARQGRDSSDRSERRGPREDRRGHNEQRHGPDREPVSIPYTTAASQFLYGKSIVEAALLASTRNLYKLYVYAGANRQNIEQDHALEKLAQRKGVEIVRVREDGLKMMDKMSIYRPHNGYILEASPLPQPPVTSLAALSDTYETKPGYNVILAHQSREEAEVNGTDSFVPTTPLVKTHKPLVVVLDSVLDPGNVGAILRTVSFLGASAVVITKRGSAPLTPVVWKASAGASETIRLFSVDALPGFLIESRENGWQVYAAAPRVGNSKNQERYLDAHEVEDQDPLSKNPCILVIGSEGEGLSKQVKSKADFEVNIPNLSGDTTVDSLNVSVATGILCNAFMKGQLKAQTDLMQEIKQKDALW